MRKKTIVRSKPQLPQKAEVAERLYRLVTDMGITPDGFVQALDANWRWSLKALENAKLSRQMLSPEVVSIVHNRMSNDSRQIQELARRINTRNGHVPREFATLVTQTLFGFPIVQALNWMGVEGFTVARSKQALTQLGVIPPADAEVIAAVNCGRRLTGICATFTEEQANEVRRAGGLL